MTHHEVCNTPNLPTECCCPNAHLPARRIPARTTLAHCSICSRRYHIDCLPLTHRPAGDILEEDVTTGWTCIECNRDQYATKGLPLDIRHYNVHWKPSRESESDLIAHNPVVAEMIAAYRLQQAAAANDRSPATPALGELAQAQCKERAFLSTYAARLRSLAGAAQTGDACCSCRRRDSGRIRRWLDEPPCAGGMPGEGRRGRCPQPEGADRSRRTTEP